MSEMEVQEKSKKHRTNYGRKHVPLKVLKWIYKGGLSKKEFFEMYPTYDFKKEGFPPALRKQPQAEKQAS